MSASWPAGTLQTSRTSWFWITGCSRLNTVKPPLASSLLLETMPTSVQSKLKTDRFTAAFGSFLSIKSICLFVSLSVLCVLVLSSASARRTRRVRSRLRVWTSIHINLPFIAPNLHNGTYLHDSILFVSSLNGGDCLPGFTDQNHHILLNKFVCYRSGEFCCWLAN